MTMKEESSRMRCGSAEMPRSMASGRRRRCRSSSTSTPLPAASLAGLLVAAMAGTSFAFVPPARSSLSSLAPAESSCSFGGPRSLATLPRSHTRIRGRIRPADRPRSSPFPLFVSLEPPSTDTDSDELLADAILNATLPEDNNVSEDLPSGKAGSSVMSLETPANFSTELPQDNMPKDVPPLRVTSSESVPEIELVIPFEETGERHMERTRMGDDVEELTHLLVHDNVDLQPLVSPAIPVSYDEQDMVQADALTTATINNEIAVFETRDGATLAMAPNAAEVAEEYPAFIKFLFQKDQNGQTLASKVFNLALLAASFGYVFYTVFNIDRGMTRGWTPGEIGMRIPLDTWASYENSLSEKPVATKTIINIVIYLLGDWLSQTLFCQKNILDFDAARTIKNGFVGMCFGPAVHEYYEFSDWILPVDGLTLGVTNRAFKILMDQTIYLSIKCSVYILAIGVLNGESVGTGAENVKNRIKPIMFTAWKFWPLVHCVTYGLIPARHRILWVNSVDLVWNAILASKARDDDDDGEEDSVEKGIGGEVEGASSEADVSKANEDSGVGDNSKANEVLKPLASMLGSLEDPTNGASAVPSQSNKPGDDASKDDDEDNILGAQWEGGGNVKEEESKDSGASRELLAKD